MRSGNTDTPSFVVAAIALRNGVSRGKEPALGSSRGLNPVPAAKIYPDLPNYAAQLQRISSAII